MSKARKLPNKSENDWNSKNAQCNWPIILFKPFANKIVNKLF